MNPAQNYVLIVDTDPAEASNIATRSAKALFNSQTTLIDIVRSVGDFINHEDATVRVKAIKYLATVLQGVPHDTLSRQQIMVLMEFFCARIADAGSLDALVYLQNLSRFNDEMTTRTMRTLAQEFSDLQTFPQGRRFEVYHFLNLLMRDHRRALKNMGDESLKAVISIAAGEKDPRNLMVVFSILNAIIAEWDIGVHAELLFESVFCYFPITFRPPPNDPYGITAQDLKDRLRDCISSSSHFAPYLFPQLIDKLDSTSASVKKDVLQTIEACSRSYEPSMLSNYSIALWDSLKFEVLVEQDKELAEEALRCLSVIARSLNTGSPLLTNSDLLEKFLTPIIKESKEHLEEPHQKQALSIAQIIKAVGSSSPSCFVRILRAIVPTVIDLYGRFPEISKRRGLLETLQCVLDAGLDFPDTEDFSLLGSDDVMGTFKDKILAIMSQALMGTSQDEISYRSLALKCLQKACSYNQLFSDHDVGLAIQYFNELLLGQAHQGRQTLSDAAAEALKEISDNRPHLILESTLPYLLARLPGPTQSGKLDYPEVLEAMCRIGASRNISDTVLRRLFIRAEESAASSSDTRYVKAIFLTILSILNRIDLVSSPVAIEYMQRTSRIIREVAEAALGNHPLTPLNEASNMSILGGIGTAIAQSVDVIDQHGIGQQIYTLYTGQPLFIQFESIQSPILAAKLTIYLSTSLMGGIKKSVSLPYPSEELSLVANHLSQLASVEDNAIVKYGLHQHLCLLVNKFLPQELLKDVHVIGWLLHSNQESIFVLKQSSLATVFWTAKALLARLFSVDEVTSSLLNLLSDPIFGAASARAFGMLLKSDNTLSRQNGAVVRLLAKQKTISKMVPPLIEKFKSSSANTRTNCLVALAGLLVDMTDDVTTLDTDAIVPLLLQSLNIEETTVRLSALEILSAIVDQVPRSVEEHLHALISRLEAILKGSSVECRQRSLACLLLFPRRYSESKLIPCRPQVIRMISEALDDPRRHVRKDAVDCQSIWHDLRQNTANG